MPHPKPRLSDAERQHYQDLVEAAAAAIGVPTPIPADQGWQVQDEASRLRWYFVAQRLQQAPARLERFRQGIQAWRNDPETPPYWVEQWTAVLERLEQGDWSLLWQDSERMQQLRSQPPAVIVLEDALRWTIINVMRGRQAPRQPGALKGQIQISDDFDAAMELRNSDDSATDR